MNVAILSYNVRGLPWTRKYTHDICLWIGALLPDVVLFQEVFSRGLRTVYQVEMKAVGYDVFIPSDEGAFLSSGLVTAVRRGSSVTVLSNIFLPYMSYHNVEIFANKGAFFIHCLVDGKRLTIGNTHLQSTTELSWFFGKDIMNEYRKKQLKQVAEFIQCYRWPVILGGDFNCEQSPYSHVKFVRPANSLRKSTFYETGEDLDHIAWFPLQYAAPKCTYCGIQRYGPKIKRCTIFEKPWSDHAPVLFRLWIPLLHAPSQIL